MREEKADKGMIILLSRIASDNAKCTTPSRRVGKGEEIKMQRSRAGWLAIIIVSP